MYLQTCVVFVVRKMQGLCQGYRTIVLLCTDHHVAFDGCMQSRGSGSQARHSIFDLTVDLAQWNDMKSTSEIRHNSINSSV